jgi:hypothetical protein
MRAWTVGVECGIRMYSTDVWDENTWWEHVLMPSFIMCFHAVIRFSCWVYPLYGKSNRKSNKFVQNQTNLLYKHTHTQNILKTHAHTNTHTHTSTHTQTHTHANTHTNTHTHKHTHAHAYDTYIQHTYVRGDPWAPSLVKQNLNTTQNHKVFTAWDGMGGLVRT